MGATAKTERNEEIRRKFREGKTAQELADEYGVTRTRVYAILEMKQRDIPRKPRVCVNTERDREICEAFLTGKTTQELGKQYGITAGRIADVLHKNGLSARENSPQAEANRKRREAFIEALKNGNRLVDEVAKEFGYSPNYARVVIFREGISRRKLHREHWQQLSENVLDDHLSGMSYDKLAAKHGISKSSVENIVQGSNKSRFKTREELQEKYARIVGVYLTKRSAGIPFTLGEFTKEMGLTDDKTRRALTYFGIQHPSRLTGRCRRTEPSRRLEEHRDEIAEKRKNGVSMRKLAEEYQVAPATLSRFLHMAGIG